MSSMSVRTQQDGNLLENLVDRYGLAEVVDWLADLAYAKADHVQATWQDKPLAKRWEKAGKLLNRTSVQVTEVGLP